MSDLRLKPELRQCLVTHIESDGKCVIVWIQNDFKEIFKFESIRDSTLNQLFIKCFPSKRQTFEPMVDKHYIFGDKLKTQFYRVLVKSFDPEINQSLVHFIDFGYKEMVPIDCLFVFSPLFIDCRPLAQSYLLSDIRPKDVIKGFDSQRVVQSLGKHLNSVLISAIFDDKRIKVFNSDYVDVFSESLIDDGIDDILMESNVDLIAIDLNPEIIGNFLSIDFKSPKMVVDLQKDKEMSSDLIDLKEPLINGLQNSNELTLNEEISTKDEVFIDKNYKKCLKSMMKSLLCSKRVVFVTKTVSSKSIYLQLKEKWDLVEGLNRRLSEVYFYALKENEYPLKIEEISSEMIIAAQFSNDKMWYRATVIDVKPNKRLVKVFYIDFGNTETIELKFCRYLKPEFRKMSPQAIQCRPLNERLGANTLEIYETNTVELESQFVAINENQIMDIFLFDNGVLLSGDSVASSPPRLTTIENTIESQIVDSLDLKLKSKNSDQKLIEKEIQNRELNDETQAFLLTLIGTEKVVVISKANSCESFYCQLSKALKEIINPLVEDMNDFYNNSEKSLLTLEQFFDTKDKNLLIAVYSEIENRWMRAKVIDFKTDSDDSLLVEVFFVDFGIQTKVDSSVCRQLDDIYLGALLQAIHCRPIKMSYYELKRLESNGNSFSILFQSFDKNVFNVKLL